MAHSDQAWPGADWQAIQQACAAAQEQRHGAPFAIESVSVMLQGPEGLRQDCWVLQCRVGPYTALLWIDRAAGWRAGQWLPTAAADTGQYPAAYFDAGGTHPSLGDALQALMHTWPVPTELEQSVKTASALPPPARTLDAPDRSLNIERPLTTDYRDLALRLGFALAVSAFTAFAAFVCAWLEYRNYTYYAWGGPPLTLFEFLLAPTEGIRFTCLLIGVLILPVCFLSTEHRPGERPKLFRVILVNLVTAACALVAAVAMSALHLPSGH